MHKLHYCLILMVAACSSPYPYSREVADLSTNMDRLSDAVTAQYASLAADRSAEQHLKLLDHRGLVAYPISCGKPNKADELRQPCLLYPVNGEPPVLMGSEHNRADILDKIQALRAYIHALQAITNAADRTAFDGAAKRLEATLGKHASVANAAAPGASVILPAATNLILWVVGEKLDQDRYDALKLAINKANDDVKKIATHLGTGLEEINSNRTTVLGRTVRSLRQRLSGGLPGHEDRLAKTETVLAKFDTVGQAQTAAVTTALVTAHEHLVAAVNGSKPDYALLIAAITDFAAKAKAVHDAATAPAK
jgi:hypothetical protein